MTQELLTALGANAEFGMRNSELPVGDGLPDVPQPRSGDRQRAVEGASPYGADPRSPVGALHEAPADTGRLSDERARPWAGASPYEADRRFPVGEELASPADTGRLSDERAVEGASPYEAQGDSVGAALPPLQGEVAASLRADGGVRRPPTPDRLTEDGRLIAAPTETGETDRRAVGRTDRRAVGRHAHMPPERLNGGAIRGSLPTGTGKTGADPRSPVGALHETPADTGADPTAGGASPAPTETGEAAAP